MPLPQFTPPTDHSELLWEQDESLARMFAASSKFQAEVGTDDIQTTLNDHVLDWNAIGPDDIDFQKARVLIEFANVDRRFNGAWTTTGTLNVCIERKQPKQEDTKAGYRAAKNSFMRFVSSVLAEIEVRSEAVNERLLGFNPRRFANYSFLGGPQCVPESEIYQDDDQNEQTEEISLWYIELNFAIS